MNTRPADPSTAVQQGAISLLDLKVELARRSLFECDLCALHCGVNRWEGELGFCCSSIEAYCARCFLNWSEERFLIPSISIFLSGCNWNCVYCQYPELLAPQVGHRVMPSSLAARIHDLWLQGGTTIHWLGGNPDQHLWSVLETLRVCRVPLPIVWNSNGYASEKTLRLLDAVVDFHLVDFRHMTDSCATQLGVPADSGKIIKRNLKTIYAQERTLVVRHLQLPAHFDCCTEPILSWLASELPDVKLNLMHGQYRPAFRAYQFPMINRRLTPVERTQTQELAESLHLDLVV